MQDAPGFHIGHVHFKLLQYLGNWMAYCCGQVKKVNIMISSFISNFPGFHITGCARFSHNRSEFIHLFLATSPTKSPPRGTQEMVILNCPATQVQSISL